MGVRIYPSRLILDLSNTSETIGRFRISLAEDFSGNLADFFCFLCLFKWRAVLILESFYQKVRGACPHLRLCDPDLSVNHLRHGIEKIRRSLH